MLLLFRFRDTLWSEVDLIVANQEVISLHNVASNLCWSGDMCTLSLFLHVNRSRKNQLSRHEKQLKLR